MVRIAIAPVAPTPPASDQDAALMRTAIEALSDIISTSPTSDQGTKRDDKVQMNDAVETPSAIPQTPPESEKDTEQEYLDPMRSVSNALSAATSTSSTFERNAEEDGSVRETSAVGTSSVVTPTPPTSEKDAEKEYLNPMRNVSKALSVTTSTSLAFEQNVEEDDLVRETNAIGTSSAVTSSTPHAPGRVVEKEYLSLMPFSPGQTAKSDGMACGMLSHPGNLVESLNAARSEKKDKSWVERGYNWVKNFVYDRMTTAEVVRQLAKGYSIKFIAVIGLTGAGKSTIIQTLTNCDVHIEHSIKAGTNTFAMYPTIIDGQRYVLIDTPGFNDGTREDVEIFCEILDWFVTMTPYCDLTGILYVHNILSNRSTGAAELTLEVLQALCGERFYKNITIITTMWSDLGINGVIKTRKRQEELINETWKELIAGSARVHEYWHPPEPGPHSNKPLPTAHEPRNTEVQHENAEDQHQTEPNFMDLHEKVLSKLCNMMAYYKGSERVRPTIQDELRRNVPIMDTKAGKVLVEKYNLPRPTTTRPVDDESSNIPSSPSSVPAATEQIDDDVSSTLSPISSSSPLSRPPETTGQIDNESNSTLRPLNPLRATTEQTGNDSSSTLNLPSLPDLVSRPPETTEQIDNQSNSTQRPPNLTGATTEQTINSDSNILSPVKLPSRPSRPNRPPATTGESSSTSRSASTLQATTEQSHGDVSSTRGPPNRQIANGRALSQSQPTEMTALVARRQTANSRASSRSRQPQSSELTPLMVYRSSGRTRTKKTPFKKTPPNYSEEGEEGEEKDKDEKPKGGWFMNMIWAIRWFFGYGEL